MGKTTSKILVILGTITLLGFVFSFGYWYLSKNIPQEEITETPISEEEPKTTPVQKITFFGEVKERTENSLITTTNQGDSEILITEETEFFLPQPIPEEKVIEEEIETEAPKSVKAEILEFKDVKVGDKVNISAEKENDILIGIIIVVLSRK